MPAFTTLRYPCPVCGEAVEQDVDQNGKAVGVPYIPGCDRGCEDSYCTGQHEGPLAAAWDEYQEAAFEHAMGRPQDGGGDADTRHRMAEARRVK